MSRAGQVLLWVGALGVALLMAYTLVLDPGRGRNPARRDSVDETGVATVAVFYPERVLWQEFRHGVWACVHKGLTTVEESSDTEITVRTPRHGCAVRFVLEDVRGVRETKDAVKRWVDRSTAPVAIVGSSNTLLTVAIAEAIRDAAGPGRGKGPLLLVPWASTVLAERPDPDNGPVTLLDIHAGRTFRFCLNNQAQADLVVGALVASGDELPLRKAVLIEDRFDPYSVDLATSFRRAVLRVAPAAQVSEESEALGVPLLHDPLSVPGPAEDALAESICRDAEALPAGQKTWVFLPLQEEPARRMLQALRKHARRSPGATDWRLRVVCGDALDASDLAEFAERCPFPVWAISSMATKAPDTGLSQDVWVEAEIVAALLSCLDQTGNAPPSPDALRDALAHLELLATDKASPGRSLSFSRAGERVGDDLGHILFVRPDRAGVFSMTRSANGRWSPPQLLDQEVRLRNGPAPP